MKIGSKLAIIVFAVVAVVHGLRIATNTQVFVESYAVPMWMSVAGIAVTAGLAILLYRESAQPPGG